MNSIEQTDGSVRRPKSDLAGTGRLDRQESTVHSISVMNIEQPLAQEELSRLLEIDSDHLTPADQHRIDYYTLLLQDYVPAEERPLSKQIELAGLCSFGSHEYKEALFALFESVIDEDDHRNNRVRQLRELGKLTAYVWDDKDVVEDVLTRMGNATDAAKWEFLNGILLGAHAVSGTNEILEELHRRWEI